MAFSSRFAALEVRPQVYNSRYRAVVAGHPMERRKFIQPNPLFNDNLAVISIFRFAKGV
jgi:hypothetical protein